MRICSVMMKAALLLSFVAANGCKSTNRESDVRSLDNFARKQGDAVKHNVCDGSVSGGMTQQHEEYFGEWFEGSEDQSKDALVQIQADNRDKGDAEVIEAALKKALTSVPLNLQTVFFGLKNRIVINEFSNEICKGEFPALQPHARIFASEGTLDPNDFNSNSSGKITDENVKVNSCWIFNDAKQRVEIHINNDVTTGSDGKKHALAVEHSTVRIFAYVLSQIAAHADLKGAQTNDVFGANDGRTYAPDKHGISFAKNQDFVKAMIQLEQDVMADVDNSKGKYDLYFYKKMTENSQTRDSFKHYLFADSFDSYYCSSSTRNIMVSDFPKSHSTFEQLAGALENLQYNASTQTGSINMGSPYTVIGAAALNGVQVSRLFGWVGGLFRGLFRVAYGIARFAYNVVRAVAHTAVRIVRGAIYVAGQIVRGAAVLIGKAAVGAARFVGHLVRGVGYLTLGSIRFVRHVLIGRDYYSVLPENF